MDVDNTQPIGDQAQSNKQAVKRVRGVFMRLPLTRALDYPRKIYEIGEGEQVRRLSVFRDLGKSADSGHSRNLVVGSNGYGLTTGNYNSELVGITPRGINIVHPANEASKYEAIYDALFENSVFSAFIARYVGKSVPNDEVAVVYLQQAHKLSESDAQVAWSVVKSNIYDFGLVQEHAGRKVVVSRQMAIEDLQAASSNVSEPTSDVPKSNSANPLVQPEQQVPAIKSEHVSKGPITLPQGNVQPQFHFNIQIHLPETTDPDVYRAIFESIGTHLLGRSDN